ncbi:MAG: putative lipid II flippase FtsW [Chloroflexota bacterium]
MRRNVDRAKQLVGGVDPVLTLAFLALTCIGVLMVYSSSIHESYAIYGSALTIFKKELMWVAIGFIGLAIGIRVPYRWWERIAIPFFVGTTLMLAAVLTHFGHSSHGASRWISLGAGITIEPSEVIKLALVIFMASWLTSKGERIKDFKSAAIPFGMIVGLVALFIVKQPDLGTTIVVCFTMAAVFFVAGADMRHVALLGGAAAMFAWYMAHSSTYRTGRLLAFLNPWNDPTGVGFHTVQVLYALGAGGITGDGLGNSVQKDVLPAPHTDSILAVIGEEWGLIGTVLVLILFLIIAYRGLKIATNAPNGFARLLATGITAWITFQALMNFAVITSSVPFTGVPLPFISYGGTALIMSMTAVGILLNISRHATGDVVARQNSNYGRGNGRPRVPRVIDHPVPDAGTTQPRRERTKRLPAPAPVRARTSGARSPGIQ